MKSEYPSQHSVTAIWVTLAALASWASADDAVGKAASTAVATSVADSVSDADTATEAATIDQTAVDQDATDMDKATTSGANVHPLAWTFRYASARSDYIRNHVRDYTCRLIKRERIDGELQEYQFINVQMRCEQKRDGKVEQPMAVFLQFVAPKILADRRVLYVDGQHDGNILVRKGGRSLRYLKLELDPTGRQAQKETKYPITDVGFDKIIQRLLNIVSEDIKHDPTAANTKVSHFRNAKVGDRVCTHIQVMHPKPGEGLQFHKASLYVDDELHVPIRLVVHDWPEKEDQNPPLMEEYVYVNLKLNVGLSDAEFSESRLD